MISQDEKDLLLRLGEELRSNSARLEQLGMQLCSDSELASRFIHILQDIDLVSQRQNAVADILSSGDMLGKLGDTRLEHIAGLNISQDQQG